MEGPTVLEKDSGFRKDRNREIHCMYKLLECRQFLLQYDFSDSRDHIELVTLE